MTRGHYSHLDKYDPGKNDVTGDSLRTKTPSDSFRENFERIFVVAKSGLIHWSRRKMISQMETLYIDESAELLRMHKTTLAEKAASGEIPGKHAIQRHKMTCYVIVSP